MKERELEEKREKAKLAKIKQEKEKEERNKRRLIDMNPSETQEGVMDRFVSEIINCLKNSSLKIS